MTNVYISENFTVMNDAMADEYIRAQNGALSMGTKSLRSVNSHVRSRLTISLKGLIVVALLGAGLMTL